MLFQPAFWSRAADVPVTYIVNERDRPVPAVMQEEMMTRLPRAAAILRLDTGHVPAVTNPERFAQLLASVPVR